MTRYSSTHINAIVKTIQNRIKNSSICLSRYDQFLRRIKILVDESEEDTSYHPALYSVNSWLIDLVRTILAQYHDRVELLRNFTSRLRYTE